MTPPLELPRKVILRGVIDFLDWARALGAELYSGGGGWASWPACRPASRRLAGQGASRLAGRLAGRPASPGCQIATFGREKFTFATTFFSKKAVLGPKCLKTIKFRQISARAFTCRSESFIR